MLWTNSQPWSVMNSQQEKRLTDETVWSQPFHWPACSASVLSLEAESNFLVTKGITMRPRKVCCKMACCLKIALLVTWQSGVIKRLCSNSKTVDACALPPLALCSWSTTEQDSLGGQCARCSRTPRSSDMHWGQNFWAFMRAVSHFLLVLFPSSKMEY